MRSFFKLVLFIFVGCNKIRIDQPSEKVKIADEILAKTARKLKYEKGLIPCGDGGRMLDQVKLLKLAFDYRRPVTIEEGRQLLVDAVEELLAEVNSNEKIRPYLNNFPFEAKNVWIGIFLQKPDGSGFGGENLSVITANEGVMRYKIDDPKDPERLLKEIYRETYEEAVHKVIEDKSEKISF